MVQVLYRKMDVGIYLVGVLKIRHSVVVLTYLMGLWQYSKTSCKFRGDKRPFYRAEFRL